MISCNYYHKVPDDAIPPKPRKMTTSSSIDTTGGGSLDDTDGYKDPTDAVKKHRNFSNSALPPLPPRDEDKSKTSFLFG